MLHVLNHATNPPAALVSSLNYYALTRLKRDIGSCLFGSGVKDIVGSDNIEGSTRSRKPALGVSGNATTERPTRVVRIIEHNFDVLEGGKFIQMF